MTPFQARGKKKEISLFSDFFLKFGQPLTELSFLDKPSFFFGTVRVGRKPEAAVSILRARD